MKRNKKLALFLKNFNAFFVIKNANFVMERKN